MAENSAIQWTNATFNPWRGCRKVHTGCAHCYAEVNYSVKMHGVKWGTPAQGGNRIRLADAGWKAPLKWNSAAEAAGVRARVFCASLADVFEDWDGPVLNHSGERLYCEYSYSHCDYAPRETPIPVTLDDLRRDLFGLWKKTPWLDWLILTKHGLWDGADGVLGKWPRAYLPDPGPHGGNFLGSTIYNRIPNVWLLGSASDQETVRRIADHLVYVSLRRVVRYVGLSLEPLVGPVDLSRWLGIEEYMPGLWRKRTENGYDPLIDWVIVGGESDQPGHPPARACDVEWIRSVVGQCLAASVPCFVKQLGSRVLMSFDEWNELTEGGTANANFVLDGPGADRGTLRPIDKKGGEWSEWPEDVRVRSFPGETRTPTKTLPVR